MTNGARGTLLIALLGSGPVSGTQLPPEILADQLLLRAERLIEGEEPEEALEALEEILTLQAEHGIELPPEFHFRRAQATFAAGTLEPARESVTDHLTAAGRDGEFYEAALALLEDVERILERRDAPDCTGQPGGTECWMELANQPGCHVWNEGLQIESVAEWTGACSSGFATGPGTLTWEWPPDSRQEHDDIMRLGRHHGLIVMRFQDGNLAEGTYVNGVRHGDWVWKYPDGQVESGPYVDGEQHGRWLVEPPDGGRLEGPYVDGEKSGQWVETFASGNVGEGPYVEGQRNGHWVWTYPDGQVESGPYVDGEQHGDWVELFANGNVAEGPYLNGQRSGRWIWRFPSGQVEEGPYVDDEQHGRWVVHPPDGDTYYVTFVRGVRQGR